MKQESKVAAAETEVKFLEKVGHDDDLPSVKGDKTRHIKLCSEFAFTYTRSATKYYKQSRFHNQ